MTIINPKSIAGVTSITTASGADNLLTVHTNNTTERVRINNDGDVIVGSGITVSPDGDIFTTGVTTATSVNVTGTLTCTDIDAAASTLSISNTAGNKIAANLNPAAGQFFYHNNSLIVNTASTGLTVTGRVDPVADSTHDLGTNSVRWRNLYADTLYGDGSNLTGITGTTINSNADNRIITGSGTANTLNGESELTYSTYLNLTRGNTDTNFGDNSAPGVTQGIFVSNSQSTNGVFSALTLSANDVNSTNQSASFIAKSVSGGYSPEVHISSRTASNTNESNFKITSSREVEVRYQGSTKLKTTNTGVDITGNVVFASGNGIDFSATSGSGTSELFDDYEEGTFTPEFNAGSSAGACYAGGVSYSSQVGVYRKVGHVVHFIIKLQVSSGTLKSGILQINNLPFTSGNFSSYSAAGGAFVSYTTGYFSDTAHIPTAFVSPGAAYMQFYNTAGNNFAGSHLAQAAGRLDINGHYFTS